MREDVARLGTEHGTKDDVHVILLHISFELTAAMLQLSWWVASNSTCLGLAKITYEPGMGHGQLMIAKIALWRLLAAGCCLVTWIDANHEVLLPKRFSATRC